MTDKKFPLQAYTNMRQKVFVPWYVAEEAYKEYAEEYGARQSLERLAERGGFCAVEISGLLAERCRRLAKLAKK